jgi:hypothetical protein
VAFEFSKAEVMLIWHGFMAARADPFPSLAAAVASEAQRMNGLSDLRSVNREQLLARVAALTPIQTLALIDAFERFNARNERQGWGDIPTTLRAVGFRLT